MEDILNKEIIIENLKVRIDELRNILSEKSERVDEVVIGDEILILIQVLDKLIAEYIFVG